MQVQDFFTWSKLYDFPPKLDNFEKRLAIMLSGNLNFRQPASEELLNVTIVCVDTPFLSVLWIDPSVFKSLRYRVKKFKNSFYI